MNAIAGIASIVRNARTRAFLTILTDLIFASITMILIIKMMEKTMTKDANKKTLYLPLKKQWYEMIERGEKREEYREMKPYWQKRLTGRIDAVSFSYGYTKRRMTFECADN